MKLVSLLPSVVMMVMMYGTLRVRKMSRWESSSRLIELLTAAEYSD